jgi:hypothetical protein
MTSGILENEMPMPAGTSFSKMHHGILHFVSIPPNILRKILEVLRSQH